MVLSIKETAGVLKKAGFKESEIPVMVAIGMGESGLNPAAHNPRYPDDSYGLFQINMPVSYTHLTLPTICSV